MKIKINTAAGFCVGVMLIVSACSGMSAMEKIPIEIRTSGESLVRLTVEAARTPQEQEKGYMGRKNIPDGTGMIFVNTQDRRLHFWMKDTPHPLSIAYIDSRGIIREIHELTPYSTKTVSSTGSMRYALEVPAGWFSRAGITVGDSLTQASLDAILKTKN
ncbi:DUF192 domain-containing protein [Brucepastera parasyntrophica]|uniref:DUF192 domain-containing protein n=1 Tax=Brucepastera parasyntrophica TaxID=2880008 RepID=UPI002108992E|nr:DUF192 domain-containing protein [Brucepastera parasyntrophica]ULQ60647.1 DUF192 domain-containing protein [Brucepastera parasyntrophica]